MTLPQQIVDSLRKKGWSDEDIFAEARRRGYSTDNEVGAMENLAKDAGETVGAIASSMVERGKNIAGTRPSVEKNPIRAAARTIKEVGGGIGDVVGGALLGAGKMVLPEVAEEAIRKPVQSVLGSDAVQSAVAGYREWKNENPDLALALEAGINTSDVLLLGAPGALKKAFAGVSSKIPVAETTKSVLKEGGEALEESARRQSGEAIARTITPEGAKLPLLRGQTAQEAALGTGDVSKRAFGRLDAPLYSVPQIKSLVEDVRGVVRAGDENAAKNLNKLDETIEKLNRERDNLPPAAPFDSKTLRGMFDDISADTVARFPEVPNVKDVVDDLVERFSQFYNARDGMKLKYDRTIYGFHRALKDWKRQVVSEYGADVFDPVKPAGSVRKLLLDRMRERGTEFIASKIGGGGGEQYSAIGKRLWSLEEAKDMMQGKYKFDTNISRFQALRKHATLTTVMNVAGVAAFFLSGILGPTAMYTALGVLAAGNIVRVGKRAVTSALLKEGLGRGMQKASELIGKTKNIEERKLLKEEYIAMASLLINFVELEADAMNRNE